MESEPNSVSMDYVAYFDETYGDTILTLIGEAEEALGFELSSHYVLRQSNENEELEWEYVDSLEVARFDELRNIFLSKCDCIEKGSIYSCPQWEPNAQKIEDAERLDNNEKLYEIFPFDEIELNSNKLFENVIKAEGLGQLLPRPVGGYKIAKMIAAPFSTVWYAAEMAERRHNMLEFEHSYFGRPDIGRLIEQTFLLGRALSDLSWRKNIYDEALKGVFRYENLRQANQSKKLKAPQKRRLRRNAVLSLWKEVCSIDNTLKRSDVNASKAIILLLKERPKDPRFKPMQMKASEDLIGVDAIRKHIAELRKVEKL